MSYELTEINPNGHSTLFKVLGESCILFEGLLYDVATEITRGQYNGGMWLWKQDKPHGLEFLAELQTERRFTVMNPGNQYEAEVSAEALSIITTNIALNRLLWLFHGKGYNGLVVLYDRLWQSIDGWYKQVNHPELKDIHRLLD